LEEENLQGGPQTSLRASFHENHSDDAAEGQSEGKDQMVIDRAEYVTQSVEVDKELTGRLAWLQPLVGLHKPGSTKLIARSMCFVEGIR
jgi:hypothetical protein